MSKNFYNHLIEIDSLYLELDNLELEDDEKKHLAHLIDSNLHSSILSFVFSAISDEDKRTLVRYLNEKDNEKIWELLNSKIEKVEEKIIQVANELIKDLHKDISDAKVIHKKLKEGKN